MIRKFGYVFVAICVVLILLSPFFIKVNLECQSQFGPCPKEIATQINQYNGENLFQARSRVFKLLKKNLLVSDFTIQYKIPNFLETNLLLKKPEFAILDKTTAKFALVDDSGTILAVQSNSTLPTIVINNENFTIGNKVSLGEFFSLKLVQGIWMMYQVGTGEIQDDSLVVELPGPIKVILPVEGDRDLLLGEVRLVYGKVQSPESAGKYSEIDLRFKNPVLR